MNTWIHNCSYIHTRIPDPSHRTELAQQQQQQQTGKRKKPKKVQSWGGGFFLKSCGLGDELSTLVVVVARRNYEYGDSRGTGTKRERNEVGKGAMYVCMYVCM